MIDRETLMQIRQALLSLVDVIERLLNVRPKTSELRKESKTLYYEQTQKGIEDG